MLRFTAILCFSALATASSIGVGQQESTARAMWSQVVDSRSKIQSGFLKLEVSWPIANGDEEDPMCKRKDEISIWFDGEKRRFDVLVTENGVVNEELSYRRVYSNGIMLDCTECGNLDRFATESSQPVKELFVPVSLGCVNGDLYHLTTKDFREQLEFDTVFNGFVEVMVVTDSGIRGEIDDNVVEVSFGMDNALPKIFDVSLNSGQFRSFTEVRWPSQVESVPFPRRIVETTYSKNSILNRSITSVIQADVNSPISPELFTWSGLGLPDGKMVLRNPLDPELFEVTNGNLQATAIPGTADILQVEETMHSPLRRWITLSAAVCAFAILLFLIIRFR